MKRQSQKEVKIDALQSGKAPVRPQHSPLASLTRESNPLALSHRDIRLQTDSPEAQSLGYKAFTRGNEVHFAPGEYSPHTAAGREIIET